MSVTMDDSFKRWTAKCKTALAADIDLSRICAVPLTTSCAAKEMNHGHSQCCTVARSMPQNFRNWR